MTSANKFNDNRIYLKLLWKAFKISANLISTHFILNDNKVFWSSGEIMKQICETTLWTWKMHIYNKHIPGYIFCGCKSAIAVIEGESGGGCEECKKVHPNVRNKPHYKTIQHHQQQLLLQHEYQRQKINNATSTPNTAATAKQWGQFSEMPYTLFF